MYSKKDFTPAMASKYNSDLETTTAPDEKKVRKTLNPNSIYLPILLGLGVSLYLFIEKVSLPDFLQKLQEADWIWFFVAFLVLLIRDGGYIYRIRAISDGELNWKSSTFIILLWEFASAVTPSAVGGTAVAIFIITREGIKFGKSLAYVMLTALLDNLFFVIFAPIAIVAANFYGFQVFPNVEFGGNFIQQYGLKTVFYTSYGLVAFYALFFAYGLFINPRGFKWFLMRLTGLRWLRRFRKSANQTGDEMILAGQSMRGKPLHYWLKAALSTVFIWFARYLMLNALIQAFNQLGSLDHLFVFARQIVMWIVMLVSPTPGSSGTAEGVFCTFYGEYLGDSFCTAVGVIWRLYYYYPYLIVGALILPYWLKRSAKARA
jgi:uncharacterized membrane protein YbhN (UPF0104 family)